MVGTRLVQQGAKRKVGVGQVKEKTASWKAMVESMEDPDRWQKRGLEKYGTRPRGECTQLGRKAQLWCGPLPPRTALSHTAEGQ